MATQMKSINSAQNRQEAGKKGGSAPRSKATSRENQTRTQPEEAAFDPNQPVPVAHIASGPASGRQTANAFNVEASERAKKVAEKMALFGEVRQRFAEAEDLAKKGEEGLAEATKIADQQALKLYQLRVAGAATAMEVSGLLGDIFGYKEKKDGTPSKTPKPRGEAIRKRVVRAVQAYAFVHPETAEEVPAFFEAIPTDAQDSTGRTVADIVEQLDNNNLSIWQAYDLFGDIKRTAATRVAIWADPKRIGQIVQGLSEQDSIAVIAENKDLRAAYGALLDVLNISGQAVAEYMAENKVAEAA
jgi:hypothetical protein